MIMAYDLMHQKGVDAMDPDHAPSGVALRMEYSTFCQGWLPHLSPEEGERLLKFYGLTAEYDEYQPKQTDLHPLRCLRSRGAHPDRRPECGVRELRPYHRHRRRGGALSQLRGPAGLSSFDQPPAVPLLQY